jgi:hypothetical protein
LERGEDGSDKERRRRVRAEFFYPHDEELDERWIQRLHRYILDSFPRLGRAPGLQEMVDDLSLDEDSVVRILRGLEAAGVLRLDPVASWISDAYPYSATPTAHTVTFKSGVTVYCMCAIDCFFVPFLAEPDITIRSRCHSCEADIEIPIERQRVSALEPRETIIWDSSAPFDCPKTNFFCGERHLLQWKERLPEEPGKACSIDAALERGREAAARIATALGM